MGKQLLLREMLFSIIFCHYLFFKNKQSYTPLLYARLLSVKSIKWDSQKQLYLPNILRSAYLRCFKLKQERNQYFSKSIFKSLDLICL